MNEQPRNLEELLLNDSFVRWVRGLSDTPEEEFWEKWVNQNPEHKKLAQEAENVLQAMPFRSVDTSDIEQELYKLNATLDTELPALEESHPSHHRRNRIYRYLAAAAMVLIIFSAGFFVLDQQFNFSSQFAANKPVQTKIMKQVYRSSNTQSQQSPKKESGTISTGYAEQSTVIFDDGSRVVLNANSKLKFPTDNTANGDITVQLKGEAYFEIAKRKPENKRTFSVRTESGSVNVLGTKFTVQADEKHTEVALKQGVVEVKGINDTENLKYTMKPGEMAQFGKLSNSIKVDEINTDVYFSWTQNELLFDNTPLSKIVQRIEHTYGVDIVVDNPSLLDKKISGSIQNNDLDVLLKALSELLQTPIKRKRTTITIDT